MRRILIACLLVIVLLIGPALSARADLAVIELSLNTGGSAFEIHADWNENLWISDYASGEIWRIIANGGLAQVYSVGGNPSDAFPDGMGNVWWVDGPQLRRMNITTGEILTWAIPGGGRLWGVEVGYPGKVWASDDGTNQLISFDAESSWFCSYALGTDSQAYPALSGSQVWVGDTWQSKILRLDRDANLVTWWQLPENYKPNDIAIGYDGTVWFTDAKIDGFGGLNQLDPATGVVTEFALPYGFATKMLANSRGNIWYTEMNWDIERNWGTFGRLDPTFVSGSTYTPTSGTNYAYPSCSNLSVDSVSYAYIQDDTSGWSTGTYTSLVDGDGWKVYRLPDGSNPVGIAITQSGWLVDLGRKVLVNFEAGVPPMGNIRTYIPMVMR